ncbi:hypothetical protein D5086_020583 [Populus alba]|uniref:Uncharacterized protein n=1 Tax=Populus alba TaxID=43335 RepID=A0ACC4BKV1_POPAL
MVKGRQGERVRLYVRGTILGYKRSKSNQYPNTSLVQVEGVNTKEEVAWYAGKRMAYIYKAKVKKNGTHYRCIWGKVTRPHGSSSAGFHVSQQYLSYRAMISVDLFFDLRCGWCLPCGPLYIFSILGCYGTVLMRIVTPKFMDSELLFLSYDILISQPMFGKHRKR